MLSAPDLGFAFFFVIKLAACGLTASVFFLSVFRWWFDGVINGGEFIGLLGVYGILFFLVLGPVSEGVRILSAILMVVGSVCLLLVPWLHAKTESKRLASDKEEAYRAAIAFNPGNVAARIELAMLLNDEKRHSEAISEMQLAVQLSPKTTENERRLLQRWLSERENRPPETMICRWCREETPRNEPRCVHCGRPTGYLQETTEILSEEIPSIVRSMLLIFPILIVLSFLFSRPGPVGILFMMIVALCAAWYWLRKRD
jgi:hypothetical protein